MPVCKNIRIEVIFVPRLEQGLNALQSFIVITAVPVSFIVAVTLLTGPIAAIKMTKAQNARQAEKALQTA